MITLTTEQAQQIDEALKLAIRTSYSEHNNIKFEASLATIRAARAQEQAEQEPVAWVGEFAKPTAEYPEGTPLYAAPILTENLTYYEVIEICKDPSTSPCNPWWLKDDVVLQDVRNAAMRFARAVIAADREKNNVK